MGRHILTVNTSTKRAGSINRCYSRNINYRCRFYLTCECLCSILGKLENTNPLLIVENILVDLLVIKINHIRMEILHVELSNLLECWILNAVMTTENLFNAVLNHSQSGQAKDVELDKAHGLKLTNILTFRPWSLANTLGWNERHVLVERLTNHNTTSMPRARLYLTCEITTMLLNLWILTEESLKWIRELHNLAQRWRIYTSLNTMTGLGQWCCFTNHLWCNRVDLGEWNLIQTRDVFDERL